MKSLVFATALAVSAITSTASVAAQPKRERAVTENIVVSQQQCLEAAKEAIRDEGFTQNVQSNNQSVIGTRGGLRMEMHCRANQQRFAFLITGSFSDLVELGQSN
jgi:hypothetical protein